MGSLLWTREKRLGGLSYRLFSYILVSESLMGALEGIVVVVVVVVVAVAVAVWDGVLGV